MGKRNTPSREKRRAFVVVVDNDLSVGRALIRLLLAANLDAVAFTCAETFLRSARSHPPDCLLLDIHIPGSSGFQVREQLEEMGCRFPVVFITAQTDPSLQQRALESGAAGFLQKPLSEETLLAAINNAIQIK